MKWALLLAVVVAFLGVVYFIRKPNNNVCKTFWDYYSDRDTNDNCYYNPDHELEVPEIVARHGYPLESHQVVTEDGYILTLFRIPHGKKPNSKPGKPVLVQHGITLNAAAFLTTGNRSLGFVLADAGYDVWLGNFRGSKYSENHTTLDNTGAEFSNYSFHELGVYDLPAEINLINQITKQKIIYIGYSMGSTAGYVYGATYPNISAEKLEVFIGLAPGVFLKNMPIFYYFGDILFSFAPLQVWTNGKLYPRPVLPSLLFRWLCLPLPIQMQICQIPDMVILGLNYGQNDPETLPVTLHHNSDATTIKTINHFLQLVRSRDFQHFDYGEKKNNELYGSAKPPPYDLTNIKFPNYLIYALNDNMVTKANTEYLYDVLSLNAKMYGIYGIKNEDFNHIDIVTGKDAKTFVYDPIVEFLNSL